MRATCSGWLCLHAGELTCSTAQQTSNSHGSKLPEPRLCELKPARVAANHEYLKPCHRCTNKHGCPSHRSLSNHVVGAFARNRMEKLCHERLPCWCSTMAGCCVCGQGFLSIPCVPVPCRLSNTVSAAAASSLEAKPAEPSTHSPVPVKDASEDQSPSPSQAQLQLSHTADEADDSTSKPAAETLARSGLESSPEEAKQSSLPAGTPQCTSVEIHCLSVTLLLHDAGVELLAMEHVCIHSMCVHSMHSMCMPSMEKTKRGFNMLWPANWIYIYALDYHQPDVACPQVPTAFC